jgi:hypothetical protein
MPTKRIDETGGRGKSKKLKKGTGWSISRGHRSFCAIPDTAAVLISQVSSSLLPSLKERITAASYQQYAWNYSREVCPFTIFIQPREYDQRVIIRFLCKERVSPEDIHVRLEAQFGDATYSGRSIRRWYQYVRQGREDLHGEVRFRRSLIDFLDIRILALMDKQPFHSVDLIAEALWCFPLNYRVSHFAMSISASRLHLGHKSQQILTLGRARQIWDFQPPGAKARAIPVDSSDALDIKPVWQGTSENDAASDCCLYLAERDVGA